MLLAKSLKGKISSIANWRRPASGEASKPITCCSWHRGALANLQYCGDAGPLRFVAAELDADADRAGLFDAADRFTKPTLSDSVPQPFGGAMVVFGDCGIQPLYEVQFVAAMGEELADALAQLGGATLVQIDELPVFVLKLLNRADDTNEGRIREFIYWLRRLRQQYPRLRRHESAIIEAVYA